ncbi:outer membrane beta-barrel protein [Acidithiobacillus acidisediminis]|uniref:outer membrane beta-barrel protein n=1 Tax=Acidithiobacillus acidisediminis TaxID=2937799 RepID=UPI0020104E4F|nr:outer membrane beta-barrel protein [Acidithiobacillus sp. S30A2]
MNQNPSSVKKSLTSAVVALTGIFAAEELQAAPLSLPAALQIDAGPIGKLNLQGAASAYGMWQDNAFPGSGTPGNKAASADISNGLVMLSKTDGMLQFAVQAGAYNVITLGAPFASTGTFTQNTFGALPTAYVEFAPTDHFNIQVGKLFTLIGAEYTFSYQNWNINRGLLWGQENAVNKGVQLNYTAGPVTAALSWNDGFYSNRFNWVTGMLTWAVNKKNSVFLQAGGNLGHTDYVHESLATAPLQNNETIAVAGYTYTGDTLVLTPYLQYTSVPASAIQALGAGSKRTSTLGAAVLADYSFSDTMSLAGRVEYISNSGNLTDGSANLTGFGPGSHAWSLTVTPTYQKGSYFARAELAYVAASMAADTGIFGRSGLNQSQLRGMVETGFLF